MPCTRISCTSKGLSDTHHGKETHYENPLWLVEFDIEGVVDHIAYGSTNKKGPYSFVDWVDRDPWGMKTVGGKEFNFCNKFFVGNGIVLTYGKPQRFNLQPLDTFHTHAHEVHSDFFCA